MAVDCAFELRKQNIAMVSLWPGAVKTETIVEQLEESKNKTDPDTMRVRATVNIPLYNL